MISEATMKRIEKKVREVATKKAADRILKTIREDAKMFYLAGALEIAADLEITIGARDYSFDLRTGECMGSGSGV